jgi:hypothetical protein
VPRDIPSGIRVTVRDGRFGADRAADPSGHPVLLVEVRDVPYQVGDVINLPDGGDGVVRGCEMTIDPNVGILQTVYVLDG